MERPQDEQRAVLFDFIDQFLSDASSGRPLPLADYLERFPGQETLVAREYLRLVDAEDPPASPSSVEAGSYAVPSDPEVPHYAPIEEIGRGGMGRVLRVRDTRLDRELAMKVVLAPRSRSIRRFLEEARITSLLDHPGIVPLHELGTDGEGRAYFTMRFVRGRELSLVYQLAARGEGGWSRERVLEVLLKVCDTMAFAHARRIIHRDLKPANVMVGDFGEVYVMDWGLARELGREDVHDVRLRPASEGDPSQPPCSSGSGPISPLVTMDGDVLGTPYYMAPEQAQGRVREIDSRTDVYSMGAMLYQLLAGEMPYAERTSDHRAVLARVRQGPPAPLLDRRHDLPAELVAICDKAMRREPAERYGDMQAMARDVRAFLEGRVVEAYHTGRWAELSKWVGRNRGLAASIAASILLTILGLSLALYLQRRAGQELLRLVSLRQSGDLEPAFDELWPPRPERTAALERWTSQASALLEARPALERELARLRERALPFDPNAALERAARTERERSLAAGQQTIEHYLRMDAQLELEGGLTLEGENRATVQALLAKLQATRSALEAQAVQRLTWTFDDPRAQLHHDFIARLTPLLDELAGSDAGDGLLARAQRGLSYARSVEQRSIREQSDTWRAAIEAIADVRRSPAYDGLEIRPQLGLVPLGPDRRSGLWEFAHLRSGDPAVRDANGDLVIRPETGVVLVLIPGGSVTLGAQADDPSQPRYDPDALPEETPVTHVRLQPYFLSKYELTQSQWGRAVGKHSGSDAQGSATDDSALLPVGSIDWQTCDRVLREIDLLIPSEAQWDHAARAGTDTIWSFGDDSALLPMHANSAFLTSKHQRLNFSDLPPDSVDPDDGYSLTAPVGSFLPNAFGLHDVHGNVAEWCHDRGAFSYSTTPLLHRAERDIRGDGTRTIRGGGFADGPESVRSASRVQAGLGFVAEWVGVRPSREIDP